MINALYLLLILLLFGLFILGAFWMGYRAGRDQETLIVNKELPEPVRLDDDFIDKELEEDFEETK